MVPEESYLNWGTVVIAVQKNENTLPTIVLLPAYVWEGSKKPAMPRLEATHARIDYELAEEDRVNRDLAMKKNIRLRLTCIATS